MIVIIYVHCSDKKAKGQKSNNFTFIKMLAKDNEYISLKACRNINLTLTKLKMQLKTLFFYFKAINCFSAFIVTLIPNFQMDLQLVYFWGVSECKIESPTNSKIFFKIIEKWFGINFLLVVIVYLIIQKLLFTILIFALRAFEWV